MEQTLKTAQHGALVSFLSLFTSFGTLLCCALPSLLVLVGLGATVASFLSALPWLVTLSHHKNWVFLISGALIAGNFLYVYGVSPGLQKQRPACPPGSPEACRTASAVEPGYIVGFGRNLLYRCVQRVRARPVTHAVCLLSLVQRRQISIRSSNQGRIKDEPRQTRCPLFRPPPPAARNYES